MQTLPTELQTLVDLIERYPQLHARTLARVELKNHSYPVISVELGAKGADVPCVLFVGGVHGVEVIGIQVIMALLESILSRLEWDSQLQLLLTKIKLAFVPIVNPIGLQNATRCNGQRVDLMRNAPIEAETKVTFLVGGQKLSSYLPWYRGRKGVEQETQALIQYVEQLKANASSLISLDAHSGFGMTDHIWFPFAGSNKPIIWACARFRCCDSLQQPIVVFSGKLDKLVSPECSKLIAEHYRCQHIEFTDAGHDISLDSSAALIAQLKAVL